MLSSNQQAAFLSDDFLLKNKFSQQLFQDYAKSLPIIDYHNHLSPAEIASNRKFDNISDLWLAGDHYKWRAMRTLGIEEQYITGNASAKEKFDKWAYTLPYTLRNPLFHWSALELKRYFGIEELLNPNNASQIYAETKATLQQEPFRVRGLLHHMQVEVVASTDDPTDSLEHHLSFHQEGTSLQVYPTFRPDKAFGIEQPQHYNAYLQKLGLVVGFDINSFDTLMEALLDRMDYFHAHGCRVADHGLSRLYFSKNQGLSVDRILKNTLNGRLPTTEELEHFKFEVVFHLSKRYHAKGWVQQFHLGALRNTNERMLQELGPDTGFDSIGDFDQASSLAAYFNELDKTDQLAKTIIYNLNPRDNEVFASMIGNFNDGSVKGKMQYGSSWWYLDQKDGMEKQLNALSNLGLLSCFIGMLTDSRSFLSFPRHEYFRRILCQLIGQEVEQGELPWDPQWLGKIIQDICYYNAKNYFNFSPQNFRISK
jgi:glucuronate isomerase